MIPKITDINRAKDWYEVKGSKNITDKYWKEYKLFINNTKFVLGEAIMWDAPAYASNRVTAKFAHWSESKDINTKGLTEEQILDLINTTWEELMLNLLKRIFI
jgi:hypothetical protein